MVCIYCGQKTKTANSRRSKRSPEVWRRRECSNCHALFTTYEHLDWPKVVAFHDIKHLEPFSRDKLLLSIHRSLLHRKDAATAATALTDTVLTKLLKFIDNAQLDRDIVVKATTEVLKRFDKSAAVTYSAFYPTRFRVR